MTREDALEAIRKWDFLNEQEREAIETLIPELKRDDRKRIKENCIHFLELQKSHHASTVEIDECIDWLIGLVPPKWLYRLEYKDGTCGLWYNGEGKWCFEEGIGSLVDCKTKDLPMDHDERYKQGGRDWFSSCSNKEDLLHWYSLDDAEELIKKGFVFTRYLATEYHEYENETVFIKDSSLVREEIDIFELFGKTKPMFKEGDWLQYRSYKPFLVEEITKQGYCSGKECLPFEWENEIHLWTIQDAKPGDIIVESSRYITIYQNLTPTSKTTFRSFCFVDLDSKVFINEGGSHNIRGSYPATKEQRDFLFKKMKEAGNEWDEKNMKLVNLTLKEKEEIDAGFTKMMADDKVKEDIKFILANSDLSKVSTPFSDMLDWLEKKDRYMKCLQEANKKIGELVEQNYWRSEEDKKMIDNIISDLRELRNNETNEELISDYNREIDWLIKKMYEGKEN